MQTILNARIVKVGNSRGIRLPKLVLEQLGFGEQVEIEVQSDQLVIRPVTTKARQGWEEQFRLMAERGDDQLLDGGQIGASSWDEEWQW